MKTVKEYQKQFGLLDEELELFQNFLDNENETSFTIPHSPNKIITKSKNGTLSTFVINFIIIPALVQSKFNVFIK